MNEDLGDFSSEGDLGIFPMKEIRESNMWHKLSSRIKLGHMEPNFEKNYFHDAIYEPTSDHNLYRSASVVQMRPVVKSTCVRRASFGGTHTLGNTFASRLENTKAKSIEKQVKRTAHSFSKVLRNFTRRRCESETRDNEISKQLQQAEQNIGTLQSKIEIYEELLNGKYQATKVLLQQLSETVSQMEHENLKRKKETNITQVQINDLQYSLLCAEDALFEAQRGWLERFNSLLKDNSELQKTVNSQAHTIKTLLYEKQVISRDKQELLALQDAKERMAYQRSNSLKSDRMDVTALELAVLGACTCRNVSQQPCACARAASIKQRCIVDLQSEVAKMKKHLVHSERIADVFKNAFEEQLQRNHKLKKQELLSDYEKGKSINLQRISEVIKRRKDTNSTINSLVEMVCEKTDELMQQKLLTKLLAQKVVEMESLQKLNIK